MSSATFAPIPNSILRRTDLSHGAKLCAARLIQYAGRDIKAYPRLDTLADELGMSVRAVQRFLAELESYSLIKTQRRGRGQSNMYILDNALLIHRQHFNTTEVADLDMPKLAYLDTPKVAHPYKRRNNMKKEIEEITAELVNKWKLPR